MSLYNSGENLREISFPIGGIGTAVLVLQATVGLELEAYNPFVPHDAQNLSIPCAIFNLKINGIVDGVYYTPVFFTGNPSDSSIIEGVR